MGLDTAPRVLPAFADAAAGEPLQRLSDAGWARVEAAQHQAVGEIADLQAQQETTLLNDVTIEMGAILRQRQAPQWHLRPGWADGRQAMTSLMDQAVSNVESRNSAAVGRIARTFDRTVQRELVAEGLTRGPAPDRKEPDPGGWRRMREQFQVKGRDHGRDR